MIWQAAEETFRDAAGRRLFSETLLSPLLNNSAGNHEACSNQNPNPRGSSVEPPRYSGWS